MMEYIQEIEHHNERQHHFLANRNYGRILFAKTNALTAIVFFFERDQRFIAQNYFFFYRGQQRMVIRVLMLHSALLTQIGVAQTN